MTWVRWRSRGIYSAFQSSARCAARPTSGASLRPGRCTASGRGCRNPHHRRPCPASVPPQETGRLAFGSNDPAKPRSAPASAGRAAIASTNHPGPGPLRGKRRRGGAQRSPGLFTPPGSRLQAGLMRRVVPHRPAPRLPAGNREVSPGGLVLVQRLGARAVAPLPRHQYAPRAPLVPVRAPLRIGPPVRPLHAHLDY
jgi:hypothetical protein